MRAKEIIGWVCYDRARRTVDPDCGGHSEASECDCCTEVVEVPVVRLDDGGVAAVVGHERPYGCFAAEVAEVLGLGDEDVEVVEAVEGLDQDDILASPMAGWLRMTEI